MMHSVISSDQYVKNIGGGRFDILKFVLAILVVAVHTTSKDCFFHPLMRLAVPLFLLMTSFFFFLKQKELNCSHEKRVALIQYVKRILKLYAFWFFVLLPYTFFYQKWNVDFGIHTFFVIIWDVVFKDTFRASWYLSASLLNVIVVWYLSRKIKDKWLLYLGFILYVICCLFSNYYGVLLLIPDFEMYYRLYLNYFSPPYLSYPVACLFVVIGKLFAERPILLSNQKLLLLLCLSIFSLVAESSFVKINGIQNADDCFLSMIPLCICVFMIVGQSTLYSGKRMNNLRYYSTIIYCCHLSLTYIVRFILYRFDIFKGEIIYELFYFSGTFILSFILAFIILHIEKWKLFRFLRYAH